mgnify:CR=1 FL=1
MSHPGEFPILQKSFLHCGESSSERLPLPPVSSPHPREAGMQKRGAPGMVQTWRCQPTLVHPRMRGVGAWGMQTHELDLSNAPGISARLPVHSPGNFPFWSVLGVHLGDFRVAYEPRNGEPTPFFFWDPKSARKSGQSR